MLLNKLCSIVWTHFGSFDLVTLVWPHWRWEWQAIILSSPVVMIMFYHAMEVSCYHSFWAVKLQSCLCFVTLGTITCKCLQVFSWSLQDVEYVCILFKSALQSCLRIHLDCLTAIKSNLFGPQDCIKIIWGGHQGELILSWDSICSNNVID